MPSITVQFSPDLDFFLARQDRGQKLTFSIDHRPAVKHPIEALGVPHTEVELICINDQTVTFSARVSHGDVVSVYGHGDVAPTTQLVPLRPPLELPPRFVLDTHLGRLARYLRLLGFDARYANDFDDPTLAAIAAQEGRALLTRDRGLLKYRCVDHGYCLRTTDPDQQVSDVVRRFKLRPYIVPYTRCLKCNGTLRIAPKVELLCRLEEKTKRYYEEFKRCTDCSQVYWEGSHKRRLDALIGRATSV